jgi:phosphoserine phosphatase
VTLKVLPKVFPEAIYLIHSLKEQNIPLLVISATVTLIVKIVAQSIGINDAIGIALAMNEGCYLNKVTGVPSYREGKILRLKEGVVQNDIIFDEIHFYTD